jgi:hypothetical protein
MEFSKSAVSRQLLRTLPAVAIGALAGYAYYYFIGCTTGTCPITNNPWISTGYGAVMGGLLVPWRLGRKRTADAGGDEERSKP